MGSLQLNTFFLDIGSPVGCRLGIEEQGDALAPMAAYAHSNDYISPDSQK